MIRQALKVGRPQRQRIATPGVIPPSVLGWNARDSVFGMDPRFATVMDNYFPGTNFVELRRGHSEHATGVGSGAVETLQPYASGATKHLIAAGGGSVFNATVAGAATSIGSGFTSNRWQGFNFGGRLLLFNGTDAPQNWNGTTLAATAWTGLTITNLIGGIAFKHRVHLIEANSASVWIGGVDAVTGALSKFDLSLVHPEGGNLQAIGSITLDGGNGPDDLICYFMDRGDVIVYAGTNPTAAFPTSDWALVGIFKLGRVVGRRPLVKRGSDLVAITSDGYVPLLQFLREGRFRADLAVSDAISGAVSDDVRSFGSNFGWDATFYPRANWLVFNVPLSVGLQAEQHVMNTITGAWCRFRGMAAGSWTEFNEMLYFGGTGGKVFLADDTLADNAAAIEGDWQSAFVPLGGAAVGLQQHYKMFRPLVESDSPLTFEVGFGVDFAESIPVFTASSVTSEGGEWDVATWDVDSWAGGFSINKVWRSADKIGESAAVRIRTKTTAQRVRLIETDVIHETALGL